MLLYRNKYEVIDCNATLVVSCGRPVPVRTIHGVALLTEAQNKSRFDQLMSSC
jgi:hypothetical protein